MLCSQQPVVSKIYTREAAAVPISILWTSWIQSTLMLQLFTSHFFAHLHIFVFKAVQLHSR